MELHPSIQETNAVDGSSARLRVALTLLLSGRRRPKSWGMETCPCSGTQKNWLPLPSQVPLQNRYKVLDFEGQAGESGEEGLPGECPRSVQSVRSQLQVLRKREG